jgi:outer membrane receptor protein involved in Fe transport
VRWRGAPVLGYTSTNPATRRALKGDELLLVDANLNYRMNRALFGRRFDVDFQLNVNNAFNEDDIIPPRLFDNGQIRTYRFQAPREIFFATTVRL